MGTAHERVCRKRIVNVKRAARRDGRGIRSTMRRFISARQRRTGLLFGQTAAIRGRIVRDLAAVYSVEVADTQMIRVRAAISSAEPCARERRRGA